MYKFNLFDRCSNATNFQTQTKIKTKHNNILKQFSVIFFVSITAFVAVAAASLKVFVAVTGYFVQIVIVYDFEMFLR